MCTGYASKDTRELISKWEARLSLVRTGCPDVGGDIPRRKSGDVSRFQEGRTLEIYIEYVWIRLIPDATGKND